jgi:crotonobetainyl-CoA:carnitine CoA-transferase CaiB-like acyl-CoA transferase
MSKDSQVTGVLNGFRVLDFGRYIAGPLCSTVLGDFGADVIRVERLGGSEDRTIIPVTESGEGTVFLQLARNKRSLTLDTRRPEASAILKRLITGADVIVANVPADALTAMGIDYDQARTIRPDIIHCNVSSFGSKGPWQHRGGFDSVGQAMSGVAYLSGKAGHPIRQPTSWVDHATGLYAAIGVLMALFERKSSGRGQRVEASLLGSALSFNANYLIEQAMTGIGREAIGNRSFINGPTDMFACTDGWIVTHVVGDALFRRWSRLIGEPHWLDDPRFTTDTLRGQNGAALSERMALWCAERSCDEAIEQLAAAGIPSGPVLSPQQALDHPQMQAMDMFRDTPYPGSAEPVPLVRMPVDLEATPAAIDRPPARAGEHNREILGELGFSVAEIAAFKAGCVI